MPKAVIMAGGPGERFWPLTHPGFPKYCLRLDGRESLLQKTIKRLTRLYTKDDLFVVTTKAHLPIIRRELKGFPRSRILVEPSRRNTAAALYLAVSALSKRFGREEILSFYPADHLIRETARFVRTMRDAIEAARRTSLLAVVGIRPTFPATGYGYVQAGRPLRETRSARAVARFHEKPAKKNAAQYLKRRDFFWNAGIFTWKAGVFLDAMKKHAPQFGRVLDAGHSGKSYAKLPALSIDVALMEKAANVALVPARMDWCDMGNWDMFYEKGARDRARNLVLGPVRAAHCRGSLLYNGTRGPIAVEGFRDQIFVKTERGILACARGESEEAARRAAKESR